ncbi:acetaldehyde dehydrogenase (acetylating) [Hydrogenovibrio marinus]|uniref:Acetaldehyde dehydrogenase n=1 Tax=Hydrogenovibrio marinus TaxID=28885 RepID=A0A067A2A8_HYDMR|nr:acetaldehyde dehydrogenase (acetylating) [Hydrogenovibrio marinus]KDN96736.1 acetaldehyde dehydrogenase [Hydrogenovibrio marinus]BBN58981.1 acetaldehyde dehydrogenase [Hydrogenovibrio marinus]
MIKKVTVGIVGTGNIGTDLLMKIQRSKYLECSIFAGRNLASSGMSRAASMGVRVSDEGIDAIVNQPDLCQIVFDATSAGSHLIHAPILKSLGKFVIDMTPAKIGLLCVPEVNLEKAINSNNVNMITCGGQASIPLAYAITKVHPEINYIETVSTIASRSAGPGTRINIDEYIEATEKGLKKFCKVENAKAMINLNPANPAIDMQTSVLVEVDNPNIKKIELEIDQMVSRIQRYVPGYKLVLHPTYDSGRLLVTVRVQGVGDYLPKFAGNLDIINCAAINVAEHYALKLVEGVK